MKTGKIQSIQTATKNGAILSPQKFPASRLALRQTKPKEFKSFKPTNSVEHQDYCREGIQTILQKAQEFRNSPLPTDRIHFDVFGNIPQQVLNEQPRIALQEDITDSTGKKIQGMKDHVTLLPVSIMDRVTSDITGEKDPSNEVAVCYNSNALRAMSKHIRQGKLLGDKTLQSENFSASMDEGFLKTPDLYAMIDRLIDKCDAEKSKEYLAGTGLVFDVSENLIRSMSLVLFPDYRGVLNLDRIKNMEVHDNDAVPNLFQEKQYHTQPHDEVRSRQSHDTPCGVTYINESDVAYANASHPNVTQAGRDTLASLIAYDRAFTKGLGSVQDIFMLDSVKQDPEKAARLRAITPEDFTTDKKLQGLTEVTDALYEVASRPTRKNTILLAGSHNERQGLNTNKSKIVFEPKRKQDFARDWENK